ncbi:hypothetical protein [Nocardiopsis synnemataformans]|uniref:hypothetical protein n=1 Tax=Nocardiopsis synnemataformans TaxID=61305 RepID=UPI003EC0BF9E
MERGELGSCPIPPSVLRVPFAVMREQILLRTDSTLTPEAIVEEIAIPLLTAASERASGS